MDFDPDDRFRHWTGRLIYTAGVRWLAEQGKAYWLIDLIASYQPEKRVRAEEFQLWVLVVNPDKSAVVTMQPDSDRPAIVTQTLEFTDYPESRAELYCVLTPGQPATLMQPCEY